jgi:predicted acyltransferase
MSENISGPVQKRVLSLDALRGFAILTMVLSGLVPHYHNVLPAWMYHAQVPPPLHKFNASLPGITWVDLVFPFFLFALGAAIPLAMSRRIEKGAGWPKLLLGIVERGFLLGFFAIYIQHIQPWAMSSEPTKVTHLLALLGYALLFPMYTRLPRSWNKWLRWGIKAGGWIGAIILLYFLRFPDRTGFSVHRSDIIIVILTNAAIFGTLFWLITRNSLLWRLGILGLLMAVRVSGPLAGWVHEAMNPWFLQKVTWMIKLGCMQYLHIVIPGTIVGDIVLRWMKTPATEAARTWSVLKLNLITLLMIAFQFVLLIGLFTRQVPQTVVICLAMSAVGWWLFRKPGNDTERMMRTLFGWGAFWLMLGLVFEPYEGGIKKDSATMSYYYVTSGLAVFLMLAFTVIGDIFGKKRWLSLLIYNGQNPMFAYRGAQNIIIPIFAITGLNTVYDKLTGGSPWQGFAGGCFVVLLVALMTMYLSRKKIFWRT